MWRQLGNTYRLHTRQLICEHRITLYRGVQAFASCIFWRMYMSKLENDVLLNLGVADRFLVSERTVMYWNPRSFMGYQRRKSFTWAGHRPSLFNVTLEGIGDTTCLSFIYYSSCEVHVHYIWGISVMRMWIWYLKQTYEGVSLFKKNGTF